MRKITVGKNKKIFYVISLVHKSLAFEWISTRLSEHYDITFVLLNTASSPLEDFLKSNRIKVIRLHYAGKKNLPRVFVRLLLLFLKNRPSIVHAHLFDATLIGLTAAWITRIEKRIYTRHNSSYHHLYFPTAVKYDRLANLLATEIISISQATDKVLAELENVPVNKIVRIPHGFDLHDFMSPKKQRVLRVQEKWKVSEGSPRVGVIARHIEWKGIQYVVPAFREFLKSHPDACLILANASGPYHEVIINLLKYIPSKNYVLIPFEEDVAALYKLFDIYIHTPIDSTCEAFGQTYVEALAAGIPSIFTPSGIAMEFIEHGKSAWMVEFKNSHSILEGMEKVWRDPELRSRLIENGKLAVISQFEVDAMITRLRELYDR